MVVMMRCLIGLLVLGGGSMQARNVAVLIGVGKNLDDGLPALAAPSNDVRQVSAMLQKHFDFKSEDIYTLIDEAAHPTAVEEIIREALIAGVEETDLVLFYFSGHGTQVCDENRDESDGKDEALVLYGRDAFLVDDQLQELLRLTPSQNVVVILDSCHSGSSTRNDGNLRLKTLPRVHCHKPQHKIQVAKNPAMIERGFQRKRIQVLTATSGQSKFAFTNGDQSLFTKALLQVVEQHGPELSYPRMRIYLNQVLSGTGQTAAVNGGANRRFLGGLEETIWDRVVVRQVKGHVVAEGNADLGWSSGGIAIVETAKGPLEMSIVEASLTSAVLRGEVGAEVLIGDRVRLLQAAEGFVPLNVKAIGDLEKKLTTTLNDYPGFKRLVALDDQKFDIQLQQVNDTPYIQILEGEQQLRRILGEKEEDLIWSLSSFALQKSMHHAVAQLSQEHGLSVDLVDRDGNRFPCDDGRENPCSLNNGQVYRIQVKLTANHNQAVVVRAFVLSSDGSIYGLPLDGVPVSLWAGKPYVFETEFEAHKPFGRTETVMVFGSYDQKGLDWPVDGYGDAPQASRGLGDVADLVEYMLQKGRRSDVVSVPGLLETSDWVCFKVVQ